MPNDGLVQTSKLEFGDFRLTRYAVYDAADKTNLFGVLKPGETATLHLFLEYRGSTAASVTLRPELLSNLDGYLSLDRESASPSEQRLFPGETGEFRIKVSVSSKAPGNYSFRLALKCSVWSTQVASIELPLTLGAHKPLAESDGPVIKSLAAENGGEGFVVALKGERFGAKQSLPYHVLFNGVESPVKTRPDDDAMTAEVPAGATSGLIEVEVNGLRTKYPSAFTVIKELSFPAQKRFLTGESRSLQVQAFDAGHQAVQHPALTWKVSDPAIAAVDQDGVLKSLGSQSASVTVTVSSGRVSASTVVSILPRPVSLVVSPEQGALNAQARDGKNANGFVTSLPVSATVFYADGSSDHDVSWTSSNPALGFYQDGRACSAIDASAGSFTLTATANRDGTTKAAATFEVRTDGGAEVTIQ